MYSVFKKLNVPFLAPVLCCLLLPVEGWAERSEPLFEPSKELEGVRLDFVGGGILRYKGLFPVYDCALYLEKGTSPGNVLDPSALRLEFVYRVNAEADRFHAEGLRVLARNFDQASIESIKERLDRINTLFPDARKGDRCALTYIPGRGTELTYNGESLGVIEGEDFARMYFAIWLGEKPASKRLKKALITTGS